MCGIFGIWKLAETGYDFLPLIKKLMEESEGRGRDATGVAFLAKKEGTERTLYYHKLPLPPDKYAKEVADQIIPKDFKAIIVHNRHATQGDPKVNKNNHPFVSHQPNVFAFIHNGIVSSKYKGERERPAETDSVEVFLSIWDELEKDTDPLNRIAVVKKGMEVHEGSMANACLFPECIVLARHNNPISLAYIPDKKCILFASTDSMLNKALGCIMEPMFNVFHAYNIVEMKNDTLLRIDDNGVTLGGDLDFPTFKTQYSYERRWQDYGTCGEIAVTGEKPRGIIEWDPDVGAFVGEREPIQTTLPVVSGTTKEGVQVKARKLDKGEVEVNRQSLKEGDLVEDLLGWHLKYLVVYEVQDDAIWGIFGKTAGEAKRNFDKETEFETSEKKGNLKWTKSDQFVIVERGLKQRPTSVKSYVKEKFGKKAAVEEELPVITDAELQKDWDSYIGKEA